MGIVKMWKFLSKFLTFSQDAEKFGTEHRGSIPSLLVGPPFGLRFGYVMSQSWRMGRNGLTTLGQRWFFYGYSQWYQKQTHFSLLFTHMLIQNVHSHRVAVGWQWNAWLFASPLNICLSLLLVEPQWHLHFLHARTMSPWNISAKEEREGLDEQRCWMTLLLPKTQFIATWLRLTMNDSQKHWENHPKWPQI